MSEKEPTQPKINEKDQQRLTEIDAELFEFKKKAKGDAKVNLKLVEMERAKELILEKRELKGEKKDGQEKLEGRNPEELLNEFFDWAVVKDSQNDRESWLYEYSDDGKLIRMNYLNHPDEIPSHFIDEEFNKIDFMSGSDKVGIDQLLRQLKGTQVLSIREKDTNWYLQVIGPEDKKASAVYNGLKREGHYIISDTANGERQLDSSDKACAPYGVKSGERITTKSGFRATVLGVGLVGKTRKNIFFLNDGQSTVSFWEAWEMKQNFDFSAAGFKHLGSVIRAKK